MEYGLRVVSMDYYAYDPWAVLILVLMEYGLREKIRRPSQGGDKSS